MTRTTNVEVDDLELTALYAAMVCALEGDIYHEQDEPLRIAAEQSLTKLTALMEKNGLFEETDNREGTDHP